MDITRADIETSTHQGARAYQQDRTDWHRRSHITAAIADGMGSGKDSGRIAHMAVTIATAVAVNAGPESPELAINAAADAIRNLTEHERDRNDDTTLVVATVTAAGEVRVAWVGDSRAYVVTHKGRLRRLTTDHNLAPYRPNELTRSLLGPDQYHGTSHHFPDDCESHLPETATYFDPSDPAVMVVLVTDGVCGVLSDEEIGHLLMTAPNARRAAKRLTGLAVRAAESAGGEPDNATALVVDLTAGDR